MMAAAKSVSLALAERMAESTLQRYRVLGIVSSLPIRLTLHPADSGSAAGSHAFLELWRLDESEILVK